jgi:hypothetical protein
MGLTSFTKTNHFKETTEGEHSKTIQILKPSERLLYYRDVAILRFWDKGTKVLNETQFTKTFLKRQNDPIWKELMLVQTNIKAKIGMGKIISLKFYAPIIESNQSTSIEYDYERIGEDFELDAEEY